MKMTRTATLTLWCSGRYLGPECIRIALQDLCNSLFPYWLVLYVVAAPIAIAVLAVLSAREALAVELQASRVFAVAVLLWLG